MARREKSDGKREPTESKGRKDFELFQKTFTKYQQRFGLIGYKVYFHYEPIDDSFANISINQEEMCVTARLNSNLPDKTKPHRDINLCAKHEALHLLVGRLESLARSRFTNAGEIYEAGEELVRRLENLVE